MGFMGFLLLPEAYGARHDAVMTEHARHEGGDSPGDPFSRSEKTLVRGLVIGFGLVLMLLGLAGWIAARESGAIRTGVARLAQEQLLTSRLLHEVQMEEDALALILKRLVHRDRIPADGEMIQALEDSAVEIRRLSQDSRIIPHAQEWKGLLDEIESFIAEVRKDLSEPEALNEKGLEALFAHHDLVVQGVHGMVERSWTRIRRAESHIEAQSEELVQDSKMLLGTCFALAIFCALGTVRFAYRSVRRIEWAANELNQVSWQMLQSQESVARRFSHELHDELGQSLAAVRSNLTTGTLKDLEARRADCVALVDEAIANVRELSQLLRPVILDDFGLDAGLQWLAEKFAQRTRLDVDCDVRLNTRLPDETETHVFRIAQEAFTNIARHAGASRVSLRLERVGDQVNLVIEDDGRGLPPRMGTHGPSLGMVGMRARARQSGGGLRIERIQPHGLRIRVWVPARTREDEESEGYD